MRRLGDPLTISLLAGLCLLVLSACEFNRDEPQVLPQQFIGADTTLYAHDLVEVNATILRPRPGALLAYADCVASQFGKQRGQLYARRVKAIQDPQFMADAASMKVMYLLSHVRPEGKFVLTSEQVLTKCEKHGIPTV